MQVRRRGVWPLQRTNGTGTFYLDEVIVSNAYIGPLDSTPPSAPANVRDGTGADISTTSSTTQLSANWDASTDAESGISGYQYAIGTSAGGTQTVNWTSLGNVTTVTQDRLDADRTGRPITSASSRQRRRTDRQRHEFQRPDGRGHRQPPSAPANVRDGTGADISTTSSTTQLSANWDASTDAESGISGYQYAIGTTAGGTQTVNWTSLGNVTTVTKTGLSLTVGQTYYFSVQGRQWSRTDRQRHQFQRPDGRGHHAAQRAGQRAGWNGRGHLDHQFHHAVVGQLGRQPPMPKAASAATNMPSAPPPAARKP